MSAAATADSAADGIATLPRTAPPSASVPLVSVIVRSMGRPELALALQSLALQDHPALEVIVVDATGGGHPPLPPIAWRPGHVLRIVGGDVRLPRPDAANRGLDAVRGDWFTFLDDDDTCEPAHLSTLVAATHAHPEALVVYGQGRLLDAEGREESRFGHAFNRALMHFGPLFYWQAGLIAARVRLLGCRFDPAFDVCEDRDLLAQIAEHGEFAFVPVATFNYRPDLGTSGTGRGGNRVEAKRVLYDTRLKAKWAGPGTLHWARVGRRCRRGVRAFLAGDLDGARQAFEHALADYPGDPNALNGVARVALAAGDHATALCEAARAVAINPTAHEYRVTLALAQQAASRSDGATPAATPPRTAACPCGSGRRYKSCCGRLAGTVAVSADETADIALDATLARARAALATGDATQAYTLLAAGEPAVPDAAFGQLLQACCDRLCAAQRRASLWPVAHRLVERLRQRTLSRPPVASRIVVAGALEAARLREALGMEVVTADDVASWRRLADHAATLVLSDGMDPAEWLDAAVPARVVMRAARDDPGLLIERLVELDEYGTPMNVAVTVPSAASATALGGAAFVEYPSPPPAAFGVAARTPAQVCRIGLAHGDIEATHPNERAVLRALVAAALPVVASASRTEVDVVVHRRDPLREDATDDSVVEAQAAAQVVIAFDGELTAAELIVNGETGYVVSSVDEAVDVARRLAADPSLRRNVAMAARAAARARDDDQVLRVRALYRWTMR